MTVEPIEIHVEATILDETMNECPGCGFDSLVSVTAVTTVDGIPQIVGRASDCGRCDYEDGG